MISLEHLCKAVLVCFLLVVMVGWCAAKGRNVFKRVVVWCTGTEGARAQQHTGGEMRNIVGSQNCLELTGTPTPARTDFLSQDPLLWPLPQTA